MVTDSLQSLNQEWTNLRGLANSKLGEMIDDPAKLSLHLKSLIELRNRPALMSCKGLPRAWCIPMALTHTPSYDNFIPLHGVALMGNHFAHQSPSRVHPLSRSIRLIFNVCSPLHHFYLVIDVQSAREASLKPLTRSSCMSEGKKGLFFMSSIMSFDSYTGI